MRTFGEVKNPRRYEHTCSNLLYKICLPHAFILMLRISSPFQVLPPQLSFPLLRVSSHLALPPILTCAAANLWNFTSNGGNSLSSPASLAPLVSFTGSLTESWFLMVGVAVESLGGAVVRTVLSAVRAAIARDLSGVAAALVQLASHCEEITAILTRLPEQCDPATFYHEVRPFYAGTKNMASVGLPRGVLFDTGDGKGEWKQLRGGSNGQSSLFPLIDLALGIKHTGSTAAGECRRGGGSDGSEDDYHVDIVGYMPREHRRFLAELSQIWNIHDIINAAEDPEASEALRAAHVQATTALVQFRSKHIQIVTRYIILPSRHSAAPLVDAAQERQRQNLATRCTRGPEHALMGTSGTQLMPFLKNARRRTMTAANMYS